MNTGRPTVVKAGPPRRKVPLLVWVALGVVGFHAALFWLVADKHFMPKSRYVPPPTPANFGAGQRRTVDPRTGEVITETFYVVSTKLASPSPEPTAPAKE